MNERRTIREQEMTLVRHLLTLAGKNPDEINIPTQVEEYEGGKMGSINFTDFDKAPYLNDLVQVKYIDSDGTPVVITLTQNTENEILDMDFWKKDFSKLLLYPTPETVAVKDPNEMI
ncbi:DUF6984 family protein [Persicobacter diffluens]|uniref:DUF6984 domain-containing protein n=1 Tax=Persicobacter diffluens TaxID=981 RepID=A0AAN4W2D0_9BACT|nr:hypothetical protein PEDI_39730 [Persicobacter diffluens]